MSKDIINLLQMLQYRRPDGSVTEKEFIERYITPVAPNYDGYGNHYLKIGDAPKVLWSSHTDTVHRGIGMQTPWYDPKDQCIKVDQRVSSSCLGADCGAGIFIMLEMIKRQVPGLYVFHRNEESGGGGSRYIAKESRDKPDGFLAGIQAAIAFDRKGRDSVITNMWGGRTCSDAFADSVIAQLPGYKIDTGGSFTDTASYKDIVPECSNLSVGYEGAHSSGESLHVPTLLKLRDIMVAFDADKLVIARDPKAVDPFPRYTERYGRGWTAFQGGAYTPPPDPDIAIAGGRKRRRTKYDVANHAAKTLSNLCAQRSFAISRLLEYWRLDYEDVIGLLQMMDDAERKDSSKEFADKHGPSIEKVFREQLRRQSGDVTEADDVGSVDEVEAAREAEENEARRHLRSVHSFTDEEWREIETNRARMYDEVFNPNATPLLGPPKPH